MHTAVVMSPYCDNTDAMSIHSTEDVCNSTVYVVAVTTQTVFLQTEKYLRKEGRELRGTRRHSDIDTIADYLFVKTCVMCYGVLNVITEVTARKLKCSKMEVLTSNPIRLAKIPAVSKASCNPKRKGTLAKLGGEEQSGG